MSPNNSETELMENDRSVKSWAFRMALFVEESGSLLLGLTPSAENKIVYAEKSQQKRKLKTTSESHKVHFQQLQIDEEWQRFTNHHWSLRQKKEKAEPQGRCIPLLF